MRIDDDSVERDIQEKSSLASLLRSELAGFAVFEDLVEHVGEGAGAAADGLLRVLETACEVVLALARGAELVGDVEGGEDGDAQTVDGATVGGDGAHLGVDDGGEAFDVGSIGAAEVVDLIGGWETVSGASRVWSIVAP
jgi:hypothetical protein